MSDPIDRIDAALRQIENHARAARAELAELRRSPPAPAIDVEAVLFAVVNAMEPFKPGYAQLSAVMDALRAALGGKEQR